MATKKSTELTYDQLVEKCKALRLRFEIAEAEFFVGLMEIESNYMHVLQQAGIEDFDQFIRTHELCMVDRYHRFIRGCKQIGVDKALELGCSVTMGAEKLSRAKPEAVVTLLKLGKQYKANKSVAPSKQTVERWTRSILNGTPSVPNEAQQLRTKVAQLEAQVELLKSENKRLRKEVAVLRKATGQKKRTDAVV